MDGGADLQGARKEDNTGVGNQSQLSQNDTTSTTTSVTTTTVNSDSTQTSMSTTPGLSKTTTTTSVIPQGIPGGTMIYPYQSWVGPGVGVQGTAYGANIPQPGSVYQANPYTSDLFRRGGMFIHSPTTNMGNTNQYGVNPNHLPMYNTYSQSQNSIPNHQSSTTTTNITTANMSNTLPPYHTGNNGANFHSYGAQHRPASMLSESSNLIKLEGWVNSEWRSIPFDRWVIQIKEAMIRDGIYWDQDKILYARKYIANKPEHTILQNLDACEEFGTLTSFELWLERLKELLGSPTIGNFGDVFQKFGAIQWNTGETLTDVMLRLRLALNEYRRLIVETLGVRIDEPMYNILLVSKFLNICPEVYKTIVLENCDPNQSLIQMTSVWVAKSQNKLLKPFQVKEKVNYINPVTPRTSSKTNKKGSASRNTKSSKAKKNQDRRSLKLKYKFCSFCESYPSNHIYSECKRKPYCNVCGLHHIRGQFSKCQDAPRWYPKEVADKDDHKWRDKEQFLFNPKRERTTQNKKRVQHVDDEEKSEEERETNSTEDSEEVEGASQPITTVHYTKTSQVKGISKSTKPKSSRNSGNIEYRDPPRNTFYSRLHDNSRAEISSVKGKTVTPRQRTGKYTEPFTETYVSMDGLPLLKGTNFQMENLPLAKRKNFL